MISHYADMVFHFLTDWTHLSRQLVWWLSVLLIGTGTALGVLIPHFSTIAHELGHAIVATLLGKRVATISLNHDTSGNTASEEMLSSSFIARTATSPIRWLRGIFVSVAGYPAPSALAALLVFLWSKNLGDGAIGLLLAMLVYTGLKVRNAFGFLIVAVSLIFAGSVIWAEQPIISETFLLVVIGMMIGGGAKGIYEAIQVYLAYMRGEDDQRSDAYNLSRATLIPQVVWLIVFIAAYLFTAGYALLTIYSTLSGGKH